MNPANAPSLDFLKAAIEEAFRAEMSRLMAGALTAASEEAHHEWIAAMQQLVARRAALMDFAGGQKELCPPQPAQSQDALPTHSPVLPS